jgi:O-antigen biosynthesis protein
MSAIRLLRNGLRYLRAFGLRALLREAQRRLTTPLPPGMSSLALAPPPPPDQRAAPVPAAQLLAGRFAQCAPLPVFTVPRTGVPRISIVTDSINKGSLFGGVGTAMIMAALLVKARGARLRIITRTEPAQQANLHHVLTLYGLSLEHEVEFAFTHVQAPQAALNIYADELFITTSWWTTACTLAAIAPARVLYVLQEDERMFYPAGDDQLHCLRTLRNPDMRVVVNTHGLLAHLASSGLPHLREQAVAFEPAFPHELYQRRAQPAQAKCRLMFYARPNHLRNLFYFGLEVIDQAVARGLINTAQWDILFVGAHVPAVTLCDGSVPSRHEQLPWQDYAALLGSIDVGLCLMFTPHPSYPPLDLAAAGGVVVTNRYGLKTDLSSYCENILCAELDIEAMLTALQQAMALTLNEPERQRRHAARAMHSDWSASFAEVTAKYSKADGVWS